MIINLANQGQQYKNHKKVQNKQCDYNQSFKRSKVSYMCSSLLQLAVGSCDLSQAEEEKTDV